MFESANSRIDESNKQLSSGIWNLALWNKSEYPELTNDSNLYKKVTKIFNEINSTEKNTVIPPEQVTLCINNKSITAQFNKSNILTNIGMNEMAKRSVGTTSSINLAHAIGTDGTTPTLSDTALGTEVARVTIGTKSVVNQTEIYASAIEGDVLSSPPQTIEEAGIFTSLTPDDPIMTVRVTFSPFLLDIGKIFTLLTNISHKNGTQV